MNTIKDGGPAFPHEDTMSAALRPGMSLRDYFAAKAMQALISATRTTHFDAAELSYQIADSMLAAREAS